MRIQFRFPYAVISACLLLSTAGAAWAASIGGSFVGRGGGAGAMLSHAESAGVFPQTFWNNIDSGDPVVDGPSPALIDSAGTFTAVKIIYDASDSWNSDGGTATPDEKLMKGIIKANPDPDLAPANNTDRMVFVITNLPPTGTYTIIVYATANGDFAKMDVTLGATTYYIEEEDSFTEAGGVFSPASSTTPGSYELGPNYAGFTNVSPAANGTITITTRKLIEDNGATPPAQFNDGIGVAGIQIFQVSGPAPAANTDTCSITTNPQAAPPPVVEGGNVTVTVGTQGPCKVQWTKNNVPIPGAISPTLVYTTVPGDNGAQLRAIVFNNINTNTSTAATLEVDANTPPVLTQFFMKAERWTGMTGVDVGPVKNAIANSTPPNTTYFSAIGANVPQTAPDLNDFGVRLSGWIKPDVTGFYDFFIRSDDASQLYINAINATTGTNALPDVNTESPIAEETGCCEGFKEPIRPDAGGFQPYETTTDAIQLEAGKLYGVVVLLKEGGGGDFVQVAWRLTNSTATAASLLPIPPANTWTMASSAGQRASITTQPVPVTVTELETATFTIGITTTPEPGQAAVQWYVDGTAIPCATSTAYTIPSTSLSDSNKMFHVVATTLRGPLTSSIVKLTVLPDSTPPVVTTSGAMLRNDGIVQVGIGFNERLNPATLIPANFNLSAGSVTSVSLSTNSYGDFAAVVLNTTGLSVGGSYTVSVHDVTDVRGNPLAPTSPSFSVGGAAWAESGVPKRPGQVVPVGADGFDILNGGRKEWEAYDEVTMAYVQKTNDFDVRVRVVYAEPGSQWTRVGLMARYELDTGEGDGTGGVNADASAYAQTHVNPVQTIFQANRFDPTGSIPGNQISNNGHEQNQRVLKGSATSGWGTAGTPPTYPNSWLRLRREGDTLFGFRSTNGVDWVAQGSTVLLDQQPEMFVGPFAAVETANIWTSGHNAFTSPFDAKHDRLFLYQFRNFGDFSIAPPTPTLSFTRSGGNIIITYSGVLQSSTIVTGTYTDVGGATSPYTTPVSAAQLYFRSRSN